MPPVSSPDGSGRRRLRHRADVSFLPVGEINHQRANLYGKVHTSIMLDRAVATIHWQDLDPAVTLLQEFIDDQLQLCLDRYGLGYDLINLKEIERLEALNLRLEDDVWLALADLAGDNLLYHQLYYTEH